MFYAYSCFCLNGERLVSRSFVTAVKATAYWLRENIQHSDASLKKRAKEPAQSC